MAIYIVEIMYPVTLVSGENTFIKLVQGVFKSESEAHEYIENRISEEKLDPSLNPDKHEYNVVPWIVS